MQPFGRFLSTTTATVGEAVHLSDNLATYEAVVITQSSHLQTSDWQKLERFVSDGGVCLAIADEACNAVPAWFGAQPCDPERQAEVRVLFRQRNNPLGARLPDSFYVRGQFRPIAPQSDQTETELYADWRYAHHPVLTRRPLENGHAALTTITDYRDPTCQRVLYRMLRQMAGKIEPERQLGVGLLGYAPSVGELHGCGAAATEGMALRMACDLSEDRLALAQGTFPDLRVTADSAEMRDNPDIDLIIIATPPNSHAPLAMQMMDAGKHVICEKPLALSIAQTEQMQAVARANGVHLSCHQNRRWDSDYLAIKQAIADNLLGDLFYMETFIGGYGHPCGFWHSHDAVSGGTTFDWGAHYLDWMLDLMPGKITEVIGTRQNRLWHDITNADRERIQMRFANGAEAEFTHSDLAYVPKPKWYVVGTDGAVVGNWRKVETYDIDPVRYFEKHDIPSAELGADLQLTRRNERGETYTRTLPEPQRKPYPFHANLADHLLLGEPLEVPVEHSARVVAVLEAAKISAENNGRIEQVSI